MSLQNFGATIAALRKQKGMTQLELARKMGVTDKAVSKWERNLSFPDVTTLPKLAEELGIPIDELLEARTSSQESSQGKAPALIELALKAMALAMGVAVATLSLLDKIQPNHAFCMLGFGLICLALVHIADTDGTRF